MILGNRRYRIIYMALAGMDIACLLPYVLTWIERGRLWGEFPLPPAAGRHPRPSLRPVCLLVAAHDRLPRHRRPHQPPPDLITPA